MGRACRAEGVLYTLGDDRVVAEQNTPEKRGLRFGHAKRLRDDVLGARLERTPRKRGEPPEWRKALIARTLLAHAGVPDDVANAVLYLASDLASFLTSVTIDINGGLWFA
jgi:NAD(P)-dependent dehydrogenase (short-subunit alcohol dehydrogenase family)